MAAQLFSRIGRNVLFGAAILFFGLPIVWLVLAPTKTNNGLQYEPPLSFGSFEQIREAATNLFGYDGGIIWTWAANSFWYTAVSLVIALLTSVLAGYALAKFRFRGKRIVLTWCFEDLRRPTSHLPALVVALLRTKLAEMGVVLRDT